MGEHPMTSSKDQANDKRSPLIAVALLLTLALLGLFGWLLSGTETCPDGWWLWHRLSCLEPNGLGDTFAGAFAPVAFVWLVAAVLLQRKELSAQRQELIEARGVAEQQVIEARKNVAFIEQQTKILQRQREIDEERRADHHVALLIELACESAYAFRAQIVIAHLGTTMSVGNIKPSGDKAADLKEYIRQISKIASTAKTRHGDNGPVELADPEKINDLAEALRELHHTANKATPPIAAKVRQIRVRIGRLSCDTLLKHSSYGDNEQMMEAIFNNDP
jgi:hypothetical protein